MIYKHACKALGKDCATWACCEVLVLANTFSSPFSVDTYKCPFASDPRLRKRMLVPALTRKHNTLSKWFTLFLSLCKMKIDRISVEALRVAGLWSHINYLHKEIECMPKGKAIKVCWALVIFRQTSASHNCHLLKACSGSWELYIYLSLLIVQLAILVNNDGQASRGYQECDSRRFQIEGYSWSAQLHCRHTKLYLLSSPHVASFSVIFYCFSFFIYDPFFYVNLQILMSFYRRCARFFA